MQISANTIKYNLKYPVQYCHYCDNIVIYQCYENGINVGRCNNPTHLGCMTFDYTVANDDIEIKSFSIALQNKVFLKVSNSTNVLAFEDQNNTMRRVENFQKIDASTILNKEMSIRLMNDIHQLVLQS